MKKGKTLVALAATAAIGLSGCGKKANSQEKPEPVTALTYTVAPFKEQDKLDDGLLKTSDGSYVRISTAIYWIDEKKEQSASIIQDKLKEGFIQFPNGTYHHIDSIDKIEESNCFIATAVYGHINAPQVQTLREFRNNVLMQTPAGRAFIDLYYSGFGRKAADFIRKHLTSAIPIIRRGLDFLDETYERRK